MCNGSLIYRCYRCHITWLHSNLCRSSQRIIYRSTFTLFAGIVAMRSRILTSSEMLFTEDGNIRALNKLLRDQKVCQRLLTGFDQFTVTPSTTRQKSASTFLWTSHLICRQHVENAVILVIFICLMCALILCSTLHQNRRLCS